MPWDELLYLDNVFCPRDTKSQKKEIGIENLK